MSRLIEIVPSGCNWSASSGDRKQIEKSLERLHDALRSRHLDWSDVGLLWLTNSRDFASCNGDVQVEQAQRQFDVEVVEALALFCQLHNHWPALIGATVKGSFCFSDQCTEADVNNGLLWVAFIHRLLPRIPIGVEITGRLATRSAVNALTEALNSNLGVDLTPQATCDDAVGIIFTSGSGHVAAAVGGVDFKDCYGLGQGLLQEAEGLNLTIIGGCASNRASHQSQSLYYSIESEDGAGAYHFTYEHGAVLAILPAADVLMQLDHPYKITTDSRLTLGFHSHEKYSDSKYFCVRSINGKPPREFLQQHWTEISADEFQDIIDRGLPIPAKPKAHYFSIASSSDANPRNIWPNIPVYFEVVDGEVLLRLVRAESVESYFYPIRMTPDGLIENAEELQNSMRLNSSRGDSLFAFLCESRKYVLEDLGLNAEVEALAMARPEEGNIIGVYLNGEYSTGQERSIGYHNYSQLGMILTARDEIDLPPTWRNALGG
jgi:hypothetical protein